MKPTLLLAGLLVLVFGLGCLNYTTAAGAGHHTEWAEAHGLPAPSYEVFVAGAACTAAGAALAGFAVGRRRRS